MMHPDDADESAHQFGISLTPGVRVDVVGPDGLVRLRPKERAAIAALAVHAPNPLDGDALIELMWSGDAPASARQSLHNHLARLRSLAPGLVQSSRRGYALSPAATLRAVGWDGDGPDAGVTGDLPDTPSVRRLLGEFVRQRSTAHATDLDALLDRHDPVELIDDLERAVASAPHDERRWWELMVVYSLLGRTVDARDAFQRAQEQLAGVGLEAGRRLHDLDRMARDGVTDRGRLMSDPFGRSDDDRLRVPDLAPRELGALRDALSSDAPFVVVVVGPPGLARTMMLARVLHESRIHGFDGCLVRCPTRSRLPPEPRRHWMAHRPALIALDRADDVADLGSLTSRLHADRTATAESASTSFAVAVADPSGHVFDPALAVLTVELPAGAEPDAEPDLDSLPPATLELLEILALVDEPVAPHELTTVDPDVERATQAGVRAGVVVQDMPTQQLDIATARLQRSVEQRLDEQRSSTLAASLLDLELDHESPMHRAVRRARLTWTAHGGGHAESVAAILRAIDACHRAGRFDVAATTARSALDVIEHDVGRTLDWCRVALEVGRFELATGERRGETALLDAVEVSRRLGEHSLMARGTHELCRLGTVATAGRSDPRSESLIETLLATVTEPADRARVGAAAAMVFSFAGRPDHLRAIYRTAVDDARRAGDDDALCEVLPNAYMSIPLHSDIDERFAVADELLELADRYDRPDSRWEGLHLRLSTEVMAARGDPRATHRELSACSEMLFERSRAWEMHYVRSGIALLDGDLETARAEVDASLAFAGDVNEDRVTAVFGAHHVATALVDGTIGGFVEVLRELVSDQPEVPAWRAALAAAEAHTGGAPAARRVIEPLVSGEIAWLADHTHSPAMVCLAEAAATLGDTDLLTYAHEALEPMAGTWSWCGSCTFGPIDLSLAKVSAGLDDRPRARAAAARAVASAAHLRAPRYADLATRVLLAVG